MKVDAKRFADVIINLREKLSSDKILLYRVIVVALSWFTIITGFLISSISSGMPLVWLLSFRYYTMQTNFMVSIWLTLAIIWHNKPEAFEKITGPIKGAFTLYITITFVIFAILLQFFYRPTGWAAFSNIVLHYITPIAFIIDWVLTETKIQYKWNYLLNWLIYPLCYIIFAVIHGSITGNYLYYFFDVSTLGILGFIMFVSILIAIGTALGSIYIVVNRKRIKS